MDSRQRRRAEQRARREYEATPAEGRLGDAPVEPEVHDQMVAIVRALDELFNGKAGGPGRKIGFVLMVFPFSEVGSDGRGRCNYMSNGVDRHDVMLLMREMVARFEGQPELVGRG